MSGRSKTTHEELLRRDRPYLAVACPKCGAAAGEFCNTANQLSHGARVKAVLSPRRASGSSSSVRAAPTAVESNRRRH